MDANTAWGRVEEKLDKLTDKFTELHTKVTELTVRNELVGILEQRIAKQDGRIDELEKFKLKLVGAAIGVGLLSGAGGAAGMHAYLTPAGQKALEHAAADIAKP